jgi:hypothetical protein
MEKTAGRRAKVGQKRGGEKGGEMEGKRPGEAGAGLAAQAQTRQSAQLDSQPQRGHQSVAQPGALKAMMSSCVIGTT